ncbi:MAG: reactive intermediate/imine deaminase [Flavobacteriales bacterium]|nr:MAG: reactive intermediate/imine deaminase [Flavobacteriales bacterium]|tara:strand:+ start:218 stop:598 length:381 start_codon:yes stop_codon:yes gene_type:complete
MKKIIINTKNAPAAIGPYSQAVLVDKTLYCSGQIAINPKNNLIINSSIKEETEMIMKNIFEILSSAQMNFDNIVKCTIFLKNMDDYNEVNKVYSKYFKSDPPAREAVEVSKLPKNVNVEISTIAVK